MPLRQVLSGECGPCVVGENEESLIVCITIPKKHLHFYASLAELASDGNYIPPIFQSDNVLRTKGKRLALYAITIALGLVGVLASGALSTRAVSDHSAVYAAPPRTN